MVIAGGIPTVNACGNLVATIERNRLDCLTHFAVAKEENIHVFQVQYVGC
jgi:hypothetical protein